MNKFAMISKTSAAAGILILLGAVSAGAYFSDHDAAQNSLIPGFVETSITEEFPDPDPVPDDQVTTVPKVVKISNPAASAAGCDCYVRARISVSDSDIGRGVTIHFPETSLWVRNTDGFYYYTRKLLTGEETAPLMDYVTVDSSKIPEDAKNRLDHFDINVYEESVQAGAAENYEDAWNDFGI